MDKPWWIHWRPRAAWLPLLSLLVGGLFLGWYWRGSAAAFDDVMAARGWERHSYEVKVALERKWLALLSAESGQRGYLLTGRKGFLGPYERAAQEAEAAHAELARLTEDNPGQQVRLARVHALLTARLGLLALVLKRHGDGSYGTGRADMAGDMEAGWVAMDRLRRALLEVGREEDRLLVERRAATDRAARKLTEWTGVMMAGAATLLIGSVLLMYFVLAYLYGLVERLRLGGLVA